MTRDARLLRLYNPPMPVPRLMLGQTAVLLVDVQERLEPVMSRREQLVRRTCRLLEGAAALKVPVLATEQYPRGLGPTLSVLLERIPEPRRLYEKLRFSSYVPPVAETLRELNARQVVVAGIEAHVCVLQTCLDLADAGYITAVATDAISSRRLEDKTAAIDRMSQAGVLPTTVESMLFELCREAGTDHFKRIQQIVR